MTAALLLPASQAALAQDDSGPTQLSIATPANNPLAFDSATLEATAGDDVVLTYTNNSPLPHNWHLFAGGDDTADSIAFTPLNSGPGDVESVEFTVPSDPGEYYYECDIHPFMNGLLVVSSPD
jgi:plastocyanin